MIHLRNVLLVAVALCMNAQASAQLMESDNPPKADPIYQVADIATGQMRPTAVYPVPVEKVTLPKGCVKRNWLGVYVCQRSRSLELALEKEEFALIQNGDAEGLKEWATKAENYARRSGTPYKGRILSHVAVAAASLGDVVTPLTVGREVELLEPHNVGIQNLNRLVEASAELSLGTPNLGAATLRSLLLQRKIYFDPAGIVAEGIVGQQLIGTTVPALIEEGISILQDSNGELTEAGAFVTSIAPFQPVGTYIAIAEGKAFLGDREGAQDALDQAYAWAEEHRMPPGALEIVKQTGIELLEEGGLADQWAAGGATGALRQPLGVVATFGKCVTCHAGTSVPDFQYSYKAWW